LILLCPLLHLIMMRKLQRKETEEGS
jgi:hypothetical protein